MNDDKKKFWAQIGKTALKVTQEVSPIVATNVIYTKIFDHRIETPISLSYFPIDFPDLKRDKHTFKSFDNLNLVGYLYYYTEHANKGFIVFAHGFGGGGHRCYLDVIAYLCKNGYYVFAYDMTATDESEGDRVKGFSQQTMDLNKAIIYCKETFKKASSLPFILFGHSMGAYAASTVLNVYPNVDKVIAVSGFNSSLEVIKEHANEFAPGQAETALPYIRQEEFNRFNCFAEYTATDGFAHTCASILIIHSEDDATIPIDAGFNLYKGIFSKDPRFTFIKLKDRGHRTVFYTLDGANYHKTYTAEYKKFTKQENVSEQDKNNYCLSHLDRKLWCNLIDNPLFEQIFNFMECKI